MNDISLRRGWPLLLLFIAGVVGIGLVVGLIAAPGDYVSKLKIPDFRLPEAISTPLWFALALAFAVAGWRLWMRDPASVETRLWLGIQILSWWYAPVFFIMRAPALALLVMLALAMLLGWFILRAWNRDRVSALLFVPCLAYILYVLGMNIAIVAMN